MKEKLIVDGYNMIGAWPELRELKRDSLEMARNRLMELLFEYQAVSGTEVIIVFDAYAIPGARAFDYKGPLQIIFTKENETADELIEKLVYSALNGAFVHVWVATDDALEQQITFGEGALRIPARELLRRMENSRKAVQKQVEYLKGKKTRNYLFDHIDKNIADILEDWRRK